MVRWRVFVLATTLVAAVALGVTGAGAQATDPLPYALKTRIPVPTWAGANSSDLSVDISWIDPDAGLYVLGDRTGAAVETFDVNAYRFITAAGQGAFVGPGPTGSAVGGIEQPLVVGGSFYVALPGTTANSKGEIDLINTNTLKVDRGGQEAGVQGEVSPCNLPSRWSASLQEKRQSPDGSRRDRPLGQAGFNGVWQGRVDLG